MQRPILVLGFPVDDFGRPIDPGFGRPGFGGPIDPGFGVGDPGHPDQGLPPDPGHPWLPGHRPPHIDAGLPIPPLPPALNPPPPQIWPPQAPIFPGTPEHPIEVPPGSVWPPLPPSLAGELVLVLAFVSGHGWHWCVLDPAALPPLGATLPEPPPAPAPK